MTDLVLERRNQDNETKQVGPVLITPAVDESYWAYRVKLSDRQAVVGFPKFLTIGIGFAVEDEDWNTNLPYTCDTDQILEHILVNKGDDAISNDDVRAAIVMVQDAARIDTEANS
jgi:hypothetical protein